MKLIIHRALAPLMLGIAGVANAGSVTFTDATVNPASYVTTIYKTDPTVNIAVSATGAGNPGAALAINYTNSGGMVQMLSTLGFINNAFAWNPATQGAIGTIDFSNDRFVDVGPIFNPLIAVFSRPLLLQNGKFYFATYADPSTKGAFYTSASPGPLTSVDYALFDFVTGLSDPLQHPDFSGAGSLIDFGFASRFNLGTAGVIALDGLFKFDNISIRINGVPEPSVLTLMLFGLVGLSASAKRRRRARCTS